MTDVTGVGLILDKRRRQIDVHGYTPDHDVLHHNAGEFAQAAGCLADYAVTLLLGESWDDSNGPGQHVFWPWDEESWTRATTGDVTEVMVNSAALMAAEIDRHLASAG